MTFVGLGQGQTASSPNQDVVSVGEARKWVLFLWMGRVVQSYVTDSTCKGPGEVVLAAHDRWHDPMSVDVSASWVYRHATSLVRERVRLKTLDMKK